MDQQPLRPTLDQRMPSGEASEPPFAGLGVVVVVAVAGALFGAVAGCHSLGLIGGRAAFDVTRDIERMLPGFALDSVPVPSAVRPVSDFTTMLARIGREPWLLVLTAAAGLLFCLALLRLVNPDLSGRLRRGEVERGRVGVAVLFTALIVLAAYLGLPAWVETTGFGPVRAALVGALIWLFWHQAGWLHSREEPPSRLQTLGQIITGAVVGVTADLLLRHTVTDADVEVLTRWLPAGYWSETMWRNVAVFVIGRRAWGGLVAVSLAAFLAPVRLRPRVRLALVAIPVTLASVAVCWFEVGRQNVWVERFDYGRDPAESFGLAEFELGMPPVPRALALLERSRQELVLAPAVPRSATGLMLTAKTTDAVREFLDRRPHGTTASWSAYVHLFDDRAWSWDPDGAAAVLVQQIHSSGPHPFFVGLVVERLLACQSSPLAERVVDQLLDPRLFQWRGEQAETRLAQLAWRWGRLDELRERLPGQATTLAATPPSPGREGIVTGRLLRRGLPWPSARVGLVAWEHREQFQPGRGGPPVARQVSPWPQRLIQAAVMTGLDGEFRFENLFDGRYAVVLTLTPGDVGDAPSLIAIGEIDRIEVDSAGEPVALGDVEVADWVQPGATVIGQPW